MELSPLTGGAPLTMGKYQLRGRNDWVQWYTQLVWNAQMLGVWKLVNPDKPDAPNFRSDAPIRPTRLKPDATIPSNLTMVERLSFLPSNTSDADYKEALAQYEEDRRRWQEAQNNVKTLLTWIGATVAPEITSSIMMRLVMAKKSSLQALIQGLRHELAPPMSSTNNLIRSEY
jgi:hypothetical protein